MAASTWRYLPPNMLQHQPAHLKLVPHLAPVQILSQIHRRGLSKKLETLSPRKERRNGVLLPGCGNKIEELGAGLFPARAGRPPAASAARRGWSSAPSVSLRTGAIRPRHGRMVGLPAQAQGGVQPSRCHRRARARLPRGRMRPVPLRAMVVTTLAHHSERPVFLHTCDLPHVRIGRIWLVSTILRGTSCLCPPLPSGSGPCSG